MSASLSGYNGRHFVAQISQGQELKSNPRRHQRHWVTDQNFLACTVLSNAAHLEPADTATYPVNQDLTAILRILGYWVVFVRYLTYTVGRTLNLEEAVALLHMHPRRFARAPSAESSRARKRAGAGCFSRSISPALSAHCILFGGKRCE